MDWDRVVRPNQPLIPVQLTTARDFLKLGSDDDLQLRTALMAAAAFIEGPEGAGISLAPQTWVYYRDFFEVPIELPVMPSTAITSIDYTDTDGNPQTVDSADYELDIRRGLVRPTEGNSWPTAATSYEPVVVTYVAGYARLPDDLVMAVLLLTGRYYDNRAELEGVAGARFAVPGGAQTIIDRYRRGRFAS